MNIKRYALTLAFICVFILGVKGMSANAEPIYTEGYFYYIVEDNGISITGYFGREETVELPSSIAGYPVSKLSEGAFVDTSVKTLKLPDTIMEIEAGAIGSNVNAIHLKEEQANQGNTTQPIAPGQTDISGQTQIPDQTDTATQAQAPDQAATSPKTPAPGQTDTPKQPDIQDRTPKDSKQETMLEEAYGNLQETDSISEGTIIQIDAQGEKNNTALYIIMAACGIVIIAGGAFIYLKSRK